MSHLNRSTQKLKVVHAYLKPNKINILSNIRYLNLLQSVISSRCITQLDIFDKSQVL
ncbi:hypothetical protein NEIELOOT_00337 [Neisseria elongata subsp. glycolytica ATCC 29315]|uniref:Uncharacterized protein n=1 Tax=Neisseria elongata subsp. glycolytica ATCC 29315 TaxID=546263 RepID=D4DMR2_NEIEG|nr:hypothetical protein NEIELOOT_00337 [Neisseria elongata subsp. glycolytica ATCC 29315]